MNNNIKLEVGMKIMLLNLYDGEYRGITTDVITKENKTTFSTEKKQLLSKERTGRFHIRSKYDRKIVTADISYRTYNMFSPVHFEMYSKHEYDEIYNKIKQDNLKYETRIAYEERFKNLKEKTFSDFHLLEEKLYNENTLVLRDKYVKTVCKNCKNYNSNNDTCNYDNKFYNVGKLSESNQRFFSEMSMCSWKPLKGIE